MTAKPEHRIIYTEITHGLVTHLSLTGNSLKGKTYAERLIERFVEGVLFPAEVVTFHTLKHPVPDIASD